MCPSHEIGTQMILEAHQRQHKEDTCLPGTSPDIWVQETGRGEVTAQGTQVPSSEPQKARSCLRYLAQTPSLFNRWERNR